MTPKDPSTDLQYLFGSQKPPFVGVSLRLKIFVPHTLPLERSQLQCISRIDPTTASEQPQPAISDPPTNSLFLKNLTDSANFQKGAPLFTQVVVLGYMSGCLEYATSYEVTVQRTSTVAKTYGMLLPALIPLVVVYDLLKKYTRPTPAYATLGNQGAYDLFLRAMWLLLTVLFASLGPAVQTVLVSPTHHSPNLMHPQALRSRLVIIVLRVKRTGDLRIILLDTDISKTGGVACDYRSKYIIQPLSFLSKLIAMETCIFRLDYFGYAKTISALNRSVLQPSSLTQYSYRVFTHPIDKPEQLLLDVCSGFSRRFRIELLCAMPTRCLR
ncbi:hypothetical protein EDC04DRAFT_2610652 [Pisolithus marmoratus]|nr:hypothetical protein EDC04DRAFT_2610652 [Pisolithus marmoratus]